MQNNKFVTLRRPFLKKHIILMMIRIKTIFVYNIIHWKLNPIMMMFLSPQVYIFLCLYYVINVFRYPNGTTLWCSLPPWKYTERLWLISWTMDEESWSKDTTGLSHTFKTTKIQVSFTYKSCVLCSPNQVWLTKI